MLNSYERVVIESLLKRSRDINNIQEDTGLDIDVIQNTLMSLLTKGFIKKELDLYCTCNERIKYYQESKDSILDQFAEREILLNSMLHANSPMAFYKVYLNKKDKVILEGILKNLKDFLTEAQTNKNNLNNTKDEMLFILGENNYVNTIKNIAL
jgi:predicted transcriptional regulator